MKWLYDLLGIPLGGWHSGNADTRKTTTRAYLLRLSEALHLLEPVIVPRPADQRSELRGKLRGFLLKVTVDWSGSLRGLTFECAELRVPSIDLEYEPTLTAPQDARSVEPSDRAILLAPGIFVKGVGAERQAAAFRALPALLRQRVCDVIRKHDVLYFRSRRDELGLTLRDSDLDASGASVDKLVELLSVATDLQLARGARPHIKTRRDEDGLDPRELAEQLASLVRGQLVEAQLEAHEEDDRLDVRWTEGGVPTRIVLDWGSETVDIEVQADGADGELPLLVDDDVTVATPNHGDAGGRLNHYVFFAKNVFMAGPEPIVRREAARLQSIGQPLLGELITTADELRLQLDLGKEALQVTLCDLEEVVDGGATAVRVARLLARVGAALPRGAVPISASMTRCTRCHGLWFSSAQAWKCAHCDARP